MKLDRNTIQVITFIEEELNYDEEINLIISSKQSDREFEEKLIEYSNMIVNEIAKTLKISFNEASALYNDYLESKIINLLI